jgi:hypothetical protein
METTRTDLKLPGEVVDFQERLNVLNFARRDIRLARVGEF